MTHTKPILAISSLGLGVALSLLAINIQRDRFAFTSQEQGSSDVLTGVTLVAPVQPPAAPGPSVLVVEIPTVEIVGLRVSPNKPSAPSRGQPATTTESVEPAQPPCNPKWREVESGPAGRMVREVCEPVVPDNVPRS